YTVAKPGFHHWGVEYT
ncbi:hypothetical protein MIMGU_mgv1a0132322mg, partial [Erythranthe guttata]